MTTTPRNSAAIEAADHTTRPTGAPVLKLVTPSDDPAAPTFDARRQAIRERIDRNVVVARRLGLDPLTVDERANVMLDAACQGWRTNRQCVAGSGLILDTPHPTCLRAQYHHDMLLLEHGLLTYERTGQ